MILPDTILELIEQEAVRLALIRFGTFFGLVLLSIVAGRLTPVLVKFLIRRFSPQQVKEIYENLVEPLKQHFKVAGTLILVSLSLNVLSEYSALYDFARFFIDLALTVSVAWLLSRLFRQFVRTYGIELIRRLGREVDEMLLVAETVVNVLIGFFAVLAFAKDRFDLVGLMAGLGLGGLAIAFAAQKTLEQLLSTIVLYLDRPFVPGEYIRLPNGLYGRVESIGLRSSKIRTAAKSTLVIMPNSMLTNMEIENITRGKKVMVLLYLDFERSLDDSERALVQQVVTESTGSLFGIDPGSTNITLMDTGEKLRTRARVTFFILGSTENSVRLRKRLLELSNETIARQLITRGIEFTVQEPTVYVESPIPL